MAEFQELMKQFQRMCKREDCRTTAGCPMYPSCNISQCRRIAFERPVEFEQRVMQWAAEHPEPQYPTWYEYLTDMYPAAWNIIKDKHIPADIAEKLGIEPEEG